MKRTLLVKANLAGLLLALAATCAIGAGDPEKVSLADLKTALLRKMVAAHAGDEARAKTLADLGGPKAVADRLTYTFEGGKPIVALDETKRGNDISPAAREAALAAVKDLLSHSLNKVAEGSLADGDKKYTLAKADAKALADSIRILWRAAPPPADANTALVARLDALTKEIEALKKLEARLVKVEKDGPALQKLEKAVENLGTLPAQIKALEGKAKASEDSAKALTERAAKLDKAIADATVALEKQAKANGAIEKQVGEAKTALEKQGKETAAALKKLGDDHVAALKKQADATAALKKQADDTAAALEKQGKANAALEKQVAEARAALEKQSKETMAALKKQGDDNAAALKKQSDANGTAVAKQKEEMAAAFDKQSKANAATLTKQADGNVEAVKKIAEQIAALQKQLAALEEKVMKEAEWKKLEDRLGRIEAILFPPPPPVVPCEVAEQGSYMVTPTRKHGFFGRLFPSCR